MNLEIIEATERLLKKIIESPDFQLLKKLKKEIPKLYQEEITTFKKTEEIYNYQKELHNLNKETTDDFIKAKTTLYNKKEVKDYFQLERKINDQINRIMLEIAQTISPNIKGGYLWKPKEKLM